MPETRFDANADFGGLIAQAIAARQALAGVNEEMDKLGGKSSEPKVKADTKSWDAQQKVVLAQIATLDKKAATIALRANDSDARAKADALQVKLAQLTDRAKNIDIKANGTQATLELRKIQFAADLAARDRDLNINVDKDGKATNQLNAIGRAMEAVTNKADIFKGGMVSDILAIVALLAGPLGAAIGVTLVALAGLVSVVGALGLGFGALALVVAPSLAGIGKNISAVTKAQTELNNATTNADKLKALQKMQTAYSNIPAAQRPVVDLVLQLRDALNKIGAFVMPTVIGAMTHFLNGAKAILPFVGALALGTARGLEELGKRFEAAANAAANNPNWQRVIHIIADLIPVYIVKLGTIFGNLFAGLVKLIAGFAPAGQSLLDWLIKLTARFNDWATSRGPAELRNLMEWLRDNGPKLGNTLKEIGKAFLDLSVSLAKLPLTGAELDLFRALAQVLDTIVKNPVGAWAVGLGLMAGGIAKIAEVVGRAAGGMILFGKGLLLLEGEGFLFTAGAKIRELANALIVLGPAEVIAAAGEAILTGATTALDVALAVLLSPVAAAVAGIAAVGVSLFFLATKWKETTAFFKSGFGALVLGFIPIIGWILLLITHWHGLWDLMKEIGAWILGAFLDSWHFLENILGHIHDVLIGAANAFTDMGRGIQTAWNIIVNAVSTAIGFVVSIVVGTFNHIRDVVVGIWDYLSDHWATIWRTVVLVVGGAIGYIVLLVIKNFDAIKDAILTAMNFVWHNVIEPIWNGIQTAITVAMNVIEAVISAVWNAILATVNFIVNVIWHGTIEPLFNGGSAFISTIMSIILGTISSVWNAIRDVFNTVVNFIWHNIIEPIFNGIRNTVESVLNFIWHNVVEPVWNAISGFISDRIHDIQSVIGTVLGAIQDVWGRVWQGMQDTVSTIWDTIKGIITGGWNIAAGVINHILGAVKTVLNVVDIHFLDSVSVPTLASGGQMKKLEGGGCTDCAVGQAMNGMATPVGPGMVGHKPMAIVSEGGPWDEYVIPTDPKYRGNAMNLLSGLMGDLGMFAAGGRLSDAQLAQARAAGVPMHGSGTFGIGIGPNIGPDLTKIPGKVFDIGKDILDKAISIVGGLAGEAVKLVWPVLSVPNNLFGLPDSGLPRGGMNKARDLAVNFIQGAQDKKRAAAGGSGIGGSGPAVGSTECNAMVAAGLALPGANKSFSPGCMVARLNNESGCSPAFPHANMSDSNAAAGHPSVGIAQFVPSTFAATSCPGCTDIANPLCQICASSHCSPGNCGHGGYGCAMGGILGMATGGKVPNPAVAFDEQHRGPAALQALLRLRHPRTTGEIMLAKQLGMAMGGVVRSPSMDFAAGMSSAPIKMPKLQGGGKTTNMGGINIYNPVGQTSEESMDRTTQKLSFRGLL